MAISLLVCMSVSFTWISVLLDFGSSSLKTLPSNNVFIIIYWELELKHSTQNTSIGILVIPLWIYCLVFSGSYNIHLQLITIYVELICANL